MTKPGTRSWLGTVFLLLAILVLGVLVAVQQRRETRLRAALARFQNRAYQDIHSRISTPSLEPKSSPISSLSWGGYSSLGAVIDQIRLITVRPFLTRSSRVLTVEVDAIGIQAAGRSLKSVAMLPNAPTEEIAVRDVLLQVLAPFDLAYHVKDGSLTITSKQKVNQLHESILKQLNQPMTLTWSEGDSLVSVIERVRMRTSGPGFPDGLPIFVQRDGPSAPDERLMLPDCAREELSIREQLSRLLVPLGLRYEVKDGAVLIVTELPAP